MIILSTRRQELANALTHGVGAVLAVVGLVILMVVASGAGDPWTVAGFAVFGAAAIFLYVASTLYHGHSRAEIKHVLQIVDHIAIYVLIAGSCSAFALTVLRGVVGWSLFGAVWAIAAFGIVMKSLFIEKWPVLSLILYLVMGWLICLVWGPLADAGRPNLLAFLLAGGLAYTFGTVFFVLGNRWGWFHPVWHLFVLAGTICHFFAVLAIAPIPS